MDYQQLKIMAKDLRCDVRDLFVLSRDNDPFYVGTKSQLKLAYWFKALWDGFGYQNGVHLRRMHYRMISQDSPIKQHNGAPYENTNSSWDMLSHASRYARYLGLVDPGAFDDRRNPNPQIYFEGDIGLDPFVQVEDPTDETFQFPDLPDLPVYDVDGFSVAQPYHIEIWAEKSTMNDILIPLCELYSVNLITGLGELSITHVQWLFDRLHEHKKPCRIFYLSDFDPAGQSMPVAVSRKIEKFMQDAGGIYDLRLFPFLLTHEQCVHYELPRTPIKETEQRAKEFERKFGEGATELDALEALHPGELKRILTDAISLYIDDTLDERVDEVRELEESNLNDIRSEIIESHSKELDEIRADHLGIKREFEERIAALNQRFENTRHAITNEMEQNAPSFYDISLPQPEGTREFGSGLYNSNRDYWEQLPFYKEFQMKYIIT